MVAERKPQVDVLPFRPLVADVAEDAADIPALVIYQIAEDIFLRNWHSIFFVRTDALEEFIEGLVVQRMIDETHLAGFWQFDAYT